MTTSRQKAIGSAAEREVAKLLGGIRVGMDGGPVDVLVPDYASIQVKKLATPPSLNDLRMMLDRIPSNVTMRAVVVIMRAGRGVRGSRTITFDLDDFAAWHGAEVTDGDG